MDICICININNIDINIDEATKSVLNYIKKDMEIIFTNYNNNCENNFLYKELNGKKNIKVINYNDFAKNFINNFIICKTTKKHILFLDKPCYINLIKIIPNLDFCDNDIIILNQDNEFYYIYKKEFIILNNLFFRFSNKFKYIQILKAILISKNILYINNINKNILKNKDKIIKIIIEYIINKIKKELKTNDITLILNEILSFIDLNYLYAYRNYLTNEIKKSKINIPIDFSIQLNAKELYYETLVKNNRKNNLFLVHTPYHILLSTSICLSNEYNNNSNSLFINKTFEIDDKLLNRLKCIFENIYIMDSTNTTNTIESIVDDLIYINKLLYKNTYDNIFINNDSEIKMQYILNSMLSKNGKIIYIEDGSANYIIPKNLSKLGMGEYLRDAFSNSLYINFENVQLFGSYSKIEKRYFLYPELVINNIKDNKENKSISKNLLLDSLNLIYKNGEKNKDKIIISLENIEFIKLSGHYNLNYDLDDYIDKIKSIINELSNLGKNIYIKYHPRENIEYINEYVSNLENVFILDKSKPIESYFEKNTTLISLRSTSLITFCKLQGSENAICIQNLIKKQKDDLTILFEKLGVFFPNSINDIISKVNKDL